jgi:integrase
MTPAAMRQALIILRSLFVYLVGQGYLARKPLATLVLPQVPLRQPGEDRSLNEAQRACIDEQVRALGDTEIERRLRRAIQWIQSTGLRVSEITSATCGQLRRSEKESTTSEWWISLPSRPAAHREVIVEASLIEELVDELSRQGRRGGIESHENRDVPILACFEPATTRLVAWSRSGCTRRSSGL